MTGTAADADADGGDGGNGGGGGGGTGVGAVGSRATLGRGVGGIGSVEVAVPQQAKPIWFAGSGAVRAEWSALPGGAVITRMLEGLEEAGEYFRYVAVVEGLLCAHLRATRENGAARLVRGLWRQLIVTCLAF
ncbi:unnamed protein product, partial [Phaeothamnion confervicola]